MAIELNQEKFWLNINFIDKTIQASLISTPVIDGEDYPAKYIVPPSIEGEAFDALLALNVSDFGEDVTVSDVLNYVASYQIKAVKDDFPVDEKIQAIHEKLQAISLDITAE